MKAAIYNEDRLFQELINLELDPLELQLNKKEIYLIPANSTFILPGDAIIPENYKLQFDIENEKWNLITDYRNKIYYSKLDLSSKKYELGETPADDYTEKSYIKIPCPKWDSNLNDWVRDDVKYKAELYKTVYYKISESAASKITSGYESNVLGEPYIYDTTLEDQFNFKVIKDSGIDSDYKCKNKATGKKTFIFHTKYQLSQIFDDFTLYTFSILKSADIEKNNLDTLSIEDLEKYKVL